LGNRKRNLKQAVRSISLEIGRISAKSYIYKSEPWGFYEGETYPYLNAVVLVATRLSAEEVLAKLQAIEQSLGRERSLPNAPRTIDLDILYFGRQIIEQVNLSVPHPYLAKRLFVLQPLNDINPYFIHPSLGNSTQQLLHACDDKQKALTRV